MLKEEELKKIEGGAVSYTSAAFLNAISRGINTCYNLGRTCGTALKYLLKGKSCKAY